MMEEDDKKIDATGATSGTASTDATGTTSGTGSGNDLNDALDGARNYAANLTDYLRQIEAQRAQQAALNDPEAERKKQRKLARDRVIASVGNMLNAFVDIGAAKGYAPVAKADSNVTDAYKKRYDEFVALREKNKAAYQTAMQNLDKQDYTTRKALADLALKYPQAVASAFKNNAQGQKAVTDAENNTKKTNSQVDLNSAKTDLTNAQVITEQHKPAEVDSRTSKNYSQGTAAKTNANANRTRANNSANNGGKGGRDYEEEKTTQTLGLDGKPVTLKSTTKRRYKGGRRNNRHEGFSIK